MCQSVFIIAKEIKIKNMSVNIILSLHGKSSDIKYTCILALCKHKITFLNMKYRIYFKSVFPEDVYTHMFSFVFSFFCVNVQAN